MSCGETGMSANVPETTCHPISPPSNCECTATADPGVTFVTRTTAPHAYNGPGTVGFGMVAGRGLTVTPGDAALQKEQSCCSAVTTAFAARGGTMISAVALPAPPSAITTPFASTRSSHPGVRPETVTIVPPAQSGPTTVGTGTGCAGPTFACVCALLLPHGGNACSAVTV